MIEVFKTNIREHSQATNLAAMLLQKFPDHLVNFDLEDCDKIIRLQAQKINAKEIISFLNQNSFTCEELPD